MMEVQGNYGNVEMQRQTGLLTETDRLPEAGYHPGRENTGTVRQLKAAMLHGTPRRARLTPGPFALPKTSFNGQTSMTRFDIIGG